MKKNNGEEKRKCWGKDSGGKCFSVIRRNKWRECEEEKKFQKNFEIIKINLHFADLALTFFALGGPIPLPPPPGGGGGRQALLLAQSV
jgi:hypothetical protein